MFRQTAMVQLNTANRSGVSPGSRKGTYPPAARDLESCDGSRGVSGRSTVLQGAEAATLRTVLPDIQLQDIGVRAAGLPTQPARRNLR